VSDRPPSNRTKPASTDACEHLAPLRALEEKNAELEAELMKLRDLDRAKSSFLATVTHELRTPLTSILGYSEMLSQGICGPLTPEQIDYISTIHAKGEDLLALITSMLDLSKLEAGRMAVRRENVDLTTVLSEVKATVSPVAQKKGVAFIAAIEEHLPPVLGDPLRLRQVFTNLLDNAVKFTPSGGEVRMSASARSTSEPVSLGDAVVATLPERVEVTIADTGIGIPPHERENIFDPFYQVDASSTRAFGGAGIGLSLVDRLVRAHGGEVRIASNEPFGTVFTVSLPVASAPAMRSTSAPLPMRDGR